MNTEQRQNIAPDAPRPHHLDGSKNPGRQEICGMNAYRHGLTGQLNIFTLDEKQAYDQHSKITLEVLAPVGAYELNLAQTIAERGFNSSTNDHWRLKRAGAIESSLFAMGMRHGEDNTGAPLPAHDPQPTTKPKANPTSPRPIS